MCYVERESEGAFTGFLFCRCLGTSPATDAWEVKAGTRRPVLF